mgnify:FL=1
MGRKKIEKRTFLKELRNETQQSVYGILLLVVGIFFILASFGSAGVLGSKLFQILEKAVGLGYFILPILLLTLSASFFRKSELQPFAITRGIGSLLFLASGLGILSLAKSGSGGLLGDLISTPIKTLVGIYAGGIILVGVLIISVLIIFNIEISSFKHIVNFFAHFRKKKSQTEAEDDATMPVLNGISEETSHEKNPEPEKEPAHTKERPVPPQEEDGIRLAPFRAKRYTPPPLSLLEKDKGKPGVGDIKANALIIRRTLQNFGITVEMDEISVGPSVTRYSLKPAEGVKLSRILGLQNDLSLALAAHPIRIEAPIPGKSLVGIEIPNTAKTTVGLGTLLASKEYQNTDRSLFITLGKGISGSACFADIAKMPHLLIAGATGSGKSVTIHSLLTSLLFRNAPENLRFILIDPKRVELTLYNQIPHLLTPTITDPKKAILALKWAGKEMSRRYDLLEKASVRDIESYHRNVLAPLLKKRKKEDTSPLPDQMPYIVIVIDELADIMQSYPRELEAAVVRLAQMSRAVGIHLILSTQRPSVNVITGLIKANIPARIALQVSSQIDSRTILDASGAEKLLGAGDMLYLSGEMSKPKRIQSAYITESEVKKVVGYLRDSYQHELPDEISFSQTQDDSNPLFETGGDSEDPVDDDLYEEARAIVIESKKASTSYLQRKLRIGYSRAARLMDMLEEKGVIGPAEGSRPRSVLIGEDRETTDEDEEF